MFGRVDVSTQDSCYTRIGGEPAVTAAVAALYRAILTDRQLTGCFDGVELSELEHHMTALLSQVLGGPQNYTGRDLRAAHRRLRITPEHYGLVGAYLIGVLAGLGCDDEVLGAVRDVLASVAGDVVG